MIANRVLNSLKLSVLALFLVLGAAAQHASEEPSAPDQAQLGFDDATTHITDDRLDRALAAYEADDSLQRVRPEWEPESLDPATIKPNPFIRAIAAFFRAIGGVLGYLLAAIVLFAILAGLYMVFGESLTLRLRQKQKSVRPDVSVMPDLRPEQARARALLEDADALAAEGRFAEAVHLLLFRSIDDIQEKKSGLIGRSLTAREIGALGDLPAWIRDALAPIIRVVERSFFGGQDVTESSWKDARQSYESFAFGEAWS